MIAFLVGLFLGLVAGQRVLPVRSVLPWAFTTTPELPWPERGVEDVRGDGLLKEPDGRRIHFKNGEYWFRWPKYAFAYAPSALRTSPVVTTVVDADGVSVTTCEEVEDSTPTHVKLDPLAFDDLWNRVVEHRRATKLAEAAVGEA